MSCSLFYDLILRIFTYIYPFNRIRGDIKISMSGSGIEASENGGTSAK